MSLRTSPPSLALSPLHEKGGGKAASIPLKKQRARVGWLVLIASLLLAQFVLRVHHPGAMAGFIDEYRHISRAQAAYQFEQNPMEFSHGKLLLYYWLGLFDPSGQGALVTSRLAIALVSLLTGAAVVGSARLLFGRRAVIPALLFYALVPHAVFYERLVLADPLAGALATVTAWQCIIAVRHPTRKRGMIVGLLVAATTMAKLTTALIVGLPLISIVILTSSRPRRRTLQSFLVWSEVMGRRYRAVLNWVGAINLLLWLIIGAAALSSYRTGGKPVIIDTALIGLKVDSANTLASRFSTLYEVMRLFVSSSMLLFLLALSVLLLIRKPQPTLFVLCWLILLVGPSTVIAWKVDARYLIIGQPAFAVLFGGGVIAAGDVLIHKLGPRWERYKLSVLPAAAALTLWGAVFALPFAWNAGHDPAVLQVPLVTRYIFFAGTVNAWGTREAIDYLEKNIPSEPIPTIAVLQMVPQTPDLCGLFTLYVNSRLLWVCHLEPVESVEPSAAQQWTELLPGYQDQPVIYIITDLLEPDRLPDGSWQLLYSKQRPQGGKIVSLWRIRNERGEN